MSEAVTAGTPGRAPAGLVTLERVLAVAIFALVLFQMYQSTKVGVTPRGTAAREALQHSHFSTGLSVLVLLLPRLWLRAKLPRPARPARVPRAADALARHCTTAFLMTLLVFCISGPLFAWSEGHHVSWLGVVSLPDLVPKSYRLSVSLGYFHSAVAFWILYLTGFTVLLALWQALRYRAAPWRLLPGFGWGR